jgi:hypothetical protein
MIVANERHDNGQGEVSVAAVNLHVEGEHPGDKIVIPAEQLQP